MRLVFIFIFLLSAVSCSHISQNKDYESFRAPASTLRSNCTELAKNFFGDSLSKNIPDSQRIKMIEQSEKFWSNAYRFVDKGSTTFWSRQKRKMLRMMQNLNDNDFPVYFIRDQEETMPKILKAEEYFVNMRSSGDVIDSTLDVSATNGNEVLSSIDSWMLRYSNYIDDSNKLFARYLSLQDSISQLNDLKKTTKNFPTTHEFRFINSNNEYIVEVKEFLNKEKLTRFRDTLRKKAKEIQRGWVFKKGTLKERMLQQAEDHQRLLTLYDRLNDVKLTNDARGIPNSKELTTRVDKLRALLFKRDDLRPSKSVDSLLAHRQLTDELNYVFETFKNRPLITEGKKFLESLTPSQKKILKIDDRGRAGEIIRYVKENKTLSIIYAASGLSGTAYSLSWVAIETKDLMMSKAERRMDCATAQNSDDQFFDCFQKYLEKEFKLEHPFTYVRDGYRGLLNALENDPDRMNEFKYEFEMFVQVRSKELEAKNLEEQFRKKFMERINFRADGNRQEESSDKVDEEEVAQLLERQRLDSLPKYKIIYERVRAYFRD